MSPDNKQIKQLIEDTIRSANILTDFDNLLNYFNTHSVPVTPATKSLPLPLWPLLNSLLTHPPLIQFKRPAPKSYPQVRGIFWLLRTSGLLIVHPKGKNQAFVINEEKNKFWQNLGPIEKYFFLLELWWFKSLGEVITENTGWFRSMPVFFELINWWQSLGKKAKKTFKDTESFKHSIYFIGNHNLALLSLFGLVDVDNFQPKVGSGWQVRNISKSLWGQEIFSQIQRQNQNNKTDDEPFLLQFLEKPGLLYQIYGSYFPDWKFIDFSLTTAKKMAETLVFKISLAKWSTKIAIPSDYTWEDLSDIILEAVGFDDTWHLFDFDIIEDTGRHKRFLHPEADPLESYDMSADNFIKDTWLDINQIITYTFDYGDNWQFKLELVEKKDEAIEKFQIFDVQGTPPRQYPFEDED